MLWNRKQREGKEVTLLGPKAIPDTVGRHMVVHENADPDCVWQLRGVIRPTGEKKTFHCRVFNEAQVTKAGVKVKDWTSLEDHPDLILWEGYFNEKTNEVRNEKFVKDSNSPN